MKKLTLALSAASLALVGAIGAGAVVAQDRPEGRGVGMGMGMGGDRTMTWAEFKAHADEGFAKIDVNHDGVIDKSDRQAIRDQMRSRQFDGMDKNHDGSLNRQEFDADHPHDGPPSSANTGSGSDHPAGPGRGEHRGPGMGGMGGMGAMMMMRGADSDHDGKITRAEYDASIKMHFDAMDTNHDGQISRDERQVAHAKMRAETQAHMRERGETTGGGMAGMPHGPDHRPDGDDMPPPVQ